MEAKYMIACFVVVLAYKYYIQIDLCVATITESSQQTKRTKVDNSNNQMQSEYDQSGKNSHVESKTIQDKQSTSNSQIERQNERDKENEKDEEKEKKKGKCEISVADMEKMNRILAIKENGKLVLLRGRRVNPGQSLYLIGNPNDIVVVQCLPNGQFDMQMETDCHDRMKVTVEEVLDSAHSGNYYRVGYRVNEDFLELFRCDYNAEWGYSRRVIHQLHGSTVATARPKAHFTMDGIIGVAHAEAYRSSAIRQLFIKRLGRNQRYISSDQIVIDRGHLAPAADFVHPDEQRSTFKYINVGAQFSRINRGDLRDLEKWLRQYAATTSNGLNIETGVLDEVLQLLDENGNLVDMYLGANNRIPIHKWYYKAVQDRSGGPCHVFLIYNNPFNTELPELPPNCESIPFPPGFAKHKNIICIDPKKFFPMYTHLQC